MLNVVRCRNAHAVRFGVKPLLNLQKCTTKPLVELKAGELAVVWLAKGATLAIALDRPTGFYRPMLALVRPASPLPRPQVLDAELGIARAVTVHAQAKFEFDPLSTGIAMREQDMQYREGSLILSQGRLILMEMTAGP